MTATLIPQITVVTYNETRALLVWNDADGYGIEYADGTREVVHAVQFARYIEDGADWTADETNTDAPTFGTQRTYAAGARVQVRNGSRILDGTVIDTRGGMLSDSQANVHWDQLGYTNWERIADLRPVTAPAVEAVSPDRIVATRSGEVVAIAERTATGSGVIKWLIYSLSIDTEPVATIGPNAGPAALAIVKATLAAL